MTAPFSRSGSGSKFPVGFKPGIKPMVCQDSRDNIFDSISTFLASYNLSILIQVVIL